MGRRDASLWVASMALAACAGRAAPTSETPASKTNAQASRTCQQQAPQPGSPWREMTWAEYYADVRERAARRGVEVIWITPPEVRKVRTLRRAEPDSAPAVATCAR